MALFEKNDLIRVEKIKEVRNIKLEIKFVQTHLSGIGFLKKRSMFLLREIEMINHRACNDKNYLKGSLSELKRYYIKKYVSKS